MASEWQPIETAPSSGNVLVCFPRGAKFVGESDWVIRCAHIMHGRFYAHDSPYHIDYDPTYWMPLPAAPSEQP